MKPAEFTTLILDLYNRYGEKLGINDVYAYSALGRVIKAVGEVIMSPKSPLVMDKSPKTLTMYLLSNGSIIALTNLLINVDLRDCGGETIEVTNDLYKPPSRFVVLDVSDCNNDLVRGVVTLGRRFNVRLGVWFIKELGMESLSLGFRGSLGGGLVSLVRLVVVMIGLSNIRGINDLERISNIIDNTLGNLGL